MGRHQAEVAQAAVQAVEPHERALVARTAHLFADQFVAIHGGSVAQPGTFPSLGNYRRQQFALWFLLERNR